MIQKPMDVLSQFPIRKGRKRKEKFRAAIASYAQSLGYTCKDEKGNFCAVNLVLGDPARAKFLVTAHYDTCATMPFPNLITPCNFWTFMGYQLLITALLLIPGFAVGIGVGLLTGIPRLAGLTAFVSVYIALGMMMFGPANKNNANDNTSGVVTALEMARTLPQELREQVCFVLFDLEEAGLIGSSSYRSKHKNEVKNQVVLNLDCVGEGDTIMLFPTKKVRKNKVMLEKLSAFCGQYGEKQISVRAKGFAIYPSDQGNFPYGVGICALNRNKVGYYLSRIHTKRDTVLEESNVSLLVDVLTKTIQDYSK